MYEDKRTIQANGLLSQASKSRYPVREIPIGLSEQTIANRGKPAPTRVNRDKDKDYQRNLQAKQLALQEKGLAMQREGLNKKGGKLICTRYHELGFMPDAIYQADSEYGERMCRENPALMLWYWSWAEPCVKHLMHGKTLGSQIALIMGWPLCRAWAQEMAYRQHKVKRGSLLGKAMIALVTGYFDSAAKIHWKETI